MIAVRPFLCLLGVSAAAVVCGSAVRHLSVLFRYTFDIFRFLYTYSRYDIQLYVTFVRT